MHRPAQAHSPHEHRPVLALAAIATLGFIFARLASEMVEGDTLAFDRAVLLALRRPGDAADPIGPAWLTDTIVNITSLGSNIVLGLISLIVVGYLLVSGRRSGAALVAISTAGAGLLSLLLKDAFHRARPDIVAHIVQAHSASFPSGHALGSAAVYLTLGLLLTRFDAERRVRVYTITVAVALTVLVGLSRLYLGVHWPSDVLAGWSIGSAWAIACWAIAIQLQRRHVVEEPAAALRQVPDGADWQSRQG
ncbi:MAG TPA: phosphatase PAP2 family protein [Sphingomonas sp.]|nr:phosphatase PAP2 family protein [Sphingomonas sp.]